MHKTLDELEFTSDPTTDNGIAANDRLRCLSIAIDSILFKLADNEEHKSNRKAITSNWSKQKAYPALKTKTGNK